MDISLSVQPGRVPGRLSFAVPGGHSVPAGPGGRCTVSHIGSAAGRREDPYEEKPWERRTFHRGCKFSQVVSQAPLAHRRTERGTAVSHPRPGVQLLRCRSRRRGALGGMPAIHAGILTPFVILMSTCGGGSRVRFISPCGAAQPVPPRASGARPGDDDTRPGRRRSCPIQAICPSCDLSKSQFAEASATSTPPGFEPLPLPSVELAAGGKPALSKRS